MPAQVGLRRFDNQGRPVVKILTYNIWFENVTEERIGQVLKVIEQADADFVCLQEVTDESRGMIVLSEMIKKKYLAVGGTISGN